MAAAGVTQSAAGLPSSFRRNASSFSGKSRTTRVPFPSRRLSAYLDQPETSTLTGTVSSSASGKFEKKLGGETTPFEDDSEEARASWKNYFERSMDLIRSDGGGPPRWFSPIECGPQRFENSPLLLFLPGLDGVGLGLILHQQRLGEIFKIWCLHIPVKDRTSFVDLVTLVERTIRSQNSHSPDRPIYLVGECLGGCLALAVAARNPDIDLVLVLANPGTSFSKSPLEPLVPLLEIIPDELYHRLPYTLSLAAGDPLRMAMNSLVRGLSLQQTFEDLSQGLVELSSYFSAMAEILPRETFLWKLQMLKSASAFANSRLHTVAAQTLILTSGKDQFLPSQEEGDRLLRILQKCVIRKFNDSGHFLFLEESVDFVTVIKGPNFYRRGKNLDYVSDYVPSTLDEFKQIYKPYRWFETATSPVWLSTLEDGEIVRGLAGIPSEGPVLLVGYHMLLGLELVPMVSRFITERNINLRGIAHPMMFKKLKDGSLPDLTAYDAVRALGAVPVSANNFFKLFSSKSHVLLYPGGMREALHRKGEQYKLFWPEQSEFVRMAARFGAKIIPFGVVGEDDVGELFFDYNDLMKIPYFKSQIQELTNEAHKLRVDVDGEVANQDVHLPGIFPKLPGRFYFLFGKPIETEGLKADLRNKEKCHEFYVQVKCEVESSIAYLKEKRVKDPYRSILPRLLYQARHGFTSEVPIFEL